MHPTWRSAGARDGGATPMRRPYCLRCYAALGRFEGACRVCERCGFVNLKLDQEVFWTKEKRLRELEKLAKALIAVLLVGIGLLLGFGLGGSGFGMGQGWAIGFPILVAVVFWETASKITRRKPYFRATIVWRVLLVGFGLPTLLAGVALNARSVAGVPVLAVGLGVLVLAAFLGRVGRAVAAWRDRRIRAGQRGDGTGPRGGISAGSAGGR